MELTKTKYQQTEVGLIPEDWNIKTIGEIAQVKGGGTPSTRINKYWNGTINWFTPTEIGQSKYVLKSKRKITFDGLNNSSAQLLPIGTILLTSRAGIGDLAILKEESSTNQGFQSLIANKDQDNEFLYYLMLTSEDKLLEKASGSTFLEISPNNVKSIQLLIPPLPEQKAIAEVLSDVDQLIQVTEQKLAKKRAIKQGAMQKLLTPKEDWESKTILELADSKKQLFDDGDWIESEHITSEGIRLIQTGNIGVGRYVEKESKRFIYESSFEKLNCKQLYEGDLLICRLAEPAGRACILPKLPYNKVITSVDVTVFRPRKEIANRIFLMNVFSTSEWFKKVYESVGGTTHKRISRGSLGRIEIKLPSIETQTRIATILSDMDKEIELIEQQIAKYKTLKQGLMQELLTGKTRLTV